MDRLVFGMHHLNVTQGAYTNFSHKNGALDIAGSDSSVDFFYAMSRMKCLGEMWLHNNGRKFRGYGTFAFTFVDSAGNPVPVRLADGTDRIVTLAMTHSSQKYVKCVPGKIYETGEPVYEEGGLGAQGANTYGNHIHIEVAQGLQTDKYLRLSGVYTMPNELDPRKSFFILDGYTKVISTAGIDFRHTDSVKVQEDIPMGTDAEKLVAFAETQIGNTGASYWQYFGYQDAWCSEFVSYCGYRCGFVPSKMPKADTCQKSMDFYKARGQLRTKAEYTPKPGDIVFFGDKGNDHTAIVKKVSSENLVVIEGNAGSTDWKTSRVCETVYSRASKWIWGFGTPLTQENMKKVDITEKIRKTGGDFVIGGIAGTNGTEFKVPKGATIELHTVHNSTASLNSLWHITMTSRRAFKLSSGTPTVSVKVTDEDKIVVQSQAGSPRTYWKLLE